MKHWLQASLSVPRHLAGEAEVLMESQGALSVTLTDEGDDPVLEPGVGETPLWDSVRVTGMFPGDTPWEVLVSVLSLAPGVGSRENVGLAVVKDQAWERAWMTGFEPMRFGKDLWIVPTGHHPPVPEATIVKLDPGLAFGTGTHATTRLCLEWVDSQDFTNLTVIDFGCGSGVLGIAAALKGAGKVYCVDNDHQALSATDVNAARNGVRDEIEVVHSEEFADHRADVVLANILAGTLISLAPRLCTMLGQGGKMALSGILPEQSGEVAGAYAARLGQMKSTTLDGWVLLTGAFPGSAEKPDG